MTDATRPPEADNGSTAPQEPIEERLARLEAWCASLRNGASPSVVALMT